MWLRLYKDGGLPLLLGDRLDTGRPGLDFVSQSTDTNLPHPWPAFGLAFCPASFDSAQLIEFSF